MKAIMIIVVLVILMFIICVYIYIYIYMYTHAQTRAPFALHSGHRRTLVEQRNMLCATLALKLQHITSFHFSIPCLSIKHHARGFDSARIRTLHVQSTSA